ncbi:MAG: ABC transporter ATP-binding protein [Chloroflexota bacterium]
MIQISDVTKVYTMGQNQVYALAGVSILMQKGEYVAIVGTSGSGKSTLMNIIGLLDRPTDGSYRLHDTEVKDLNKRQLATLRNKEIGFVFQRFNLLARAKAQRQVELPLFYANVPRQEARKRATDSLNLVGLGDRTDHKPEELSGGQQQRVAIARALVNQPSLLLADEPTGALDTKTGREVLDVFRQLNQQGLTIVVVTHDPEVAQEADRIITLSDGQIV